MNKPFNLEHAKAGAPVQTASGYPVQILKFDARGQYPIIGVLWNGEHDDARTWTETGALFISERDQFGDLVMAPLGYVEGKPVYVGDKLLGVKGGGFTVQPCTRIPEGNHYKWPQQYPLTQMTSHDLQMTLQGAPYPTNLLIIANAAIKHGIDHGYLYDAQVIRNHLNVILPAAPCTLEGHFAAIVRAINAQEEMNATQAKAIVKLDSEVTRMTADRDHYKKASESRAGFLSDIATQIGMKGGYVYEMVPINLRDHLGEMSKASDELREIINSRPAREVAIALYFYRHGVTAGREDHPYPTEDMFESELAKVK